jgi:rusticyanin
MKNSKLLPLAIVLMAVGAFGIIGLGIYSFQGFNNLTGMWGMMSGGKVILSSTVLNMQHSATKEVVNKAKNSITFTQSTVNLVVLAAPPARPGDYWEIDGLINPTIYIKTGTTLRVTLVNEDNKMHGFEIVTAHPPFSAYPMMSYGDVFNSFIMPIGGTNTNQYHTAKQTINPSNAGTYYYLCPVPHHAAMGMYGKLVVS